MNKRAHKPVITELEGSTLSHWLWSHSPISEAYTQPLCELSWPSLSIKVTPLSRPKGGTQNEAGFHADAGKWPPKLSNSQCVFGIPNTLGVPPVLGP